jgi:RNA-directed DNA polymerase
MPPWRPQLYKKQALEAGADPAVVANAIATAKATLAVNPALSPVLTLRRLAHLANVDYGLLRAIVARAHEDPYRVFRIRKRPSYIGEKRLRVIAVPSPGLLHAQGWITQRILAHVKPHAASVAYSKKNTIMAAAEPRCGCR